MNNINSIFLLILALISPMANASDVPKSQGSTPKDPFAGISIAPSSLSATPFSVNLSTEPTKKPLKISCRYQKEYNFRMIGSFSAFTSALVASKLVRSGNAGNIGHDQSIALGLAGGYLVGYWTSRFLSDECTDDAFYNETSLEVINKSGDFALVWGTAGAIIWGYSWIRSTRKNDGSGLTGLMAPFAGCVGLIIGAGVGSIFIAPYGTRMFADKWKADKYVPEK